MISKSIRIVSIEVEVLHHSVYGVIYIIFKERQLQIFFFLLLNIEPLRPCLFLVILRIKPSLMPPFLMNFAITFNFDIVLIVLTGTKIMKITHICKIIMIINVKCISFLFSDELSVGTVVYWFNLIEIIFHHLLVDNSQ